MTADYKSTLFLPRTAFPMKAGLPRREPGLLKRWRDIDLWGRLRAAGAGREKFILHDGPPYANGPIHIGHALNKILKDMVNRVAQMSGRDAHYIPGWDCHGLPIEWQIEVEYRKRGIDRDSIPVAEFRRRCRAFADRWIDSQMAEFVRLGVLGDWDRRYLTMSYAAEAQIVREMGKFLTSGALYRGSRPVMWSPVEKTALAEAEVEYRDIESEAVFVRFPVVSAPEPALDGAAVVIWTTTPWTIPGNRAIAYGPDIEYVVGEVTATGEGAAAAPGDRLAFAAERADEVCGRAAVTGFRRLAAFPGARLAGAAARHPLADKGYRFDVPLLPGGFVDTAQGTGFVHVAPGHGADDFELGRAHGLETPTTVDDGGRFVDDIPLFAGVHVYKAAPPVAAALGEAGALLARERYRHSYPHSWRSKKPVIFRNTPQWFIDMDATGLREIALAAIEATQFHPPSGKERLRAMIENRPDWCVSRQRAWGVPIAVFVDRRTGEPLRDAAVIDRVADAVAEHGADIWFTADPARFLGPGRDPADYEQVRDILDVWFDSGASHSYVLEGDPTQTWPAALYLEGSDQHRGWFHSSLLEACGTRGRAPYEAVLTHGFTLDDRGRKMAKSLGNVVAPQRIVEDHGADVLRLWVASVDYTDDLRIGPGIVRGVVESYRRLRNTLRYLLGNLDGFDESERVAPGAMPGLERWVLHRLAELDETRRRAFAAYEYHRFYGPLHAFCATDLSAFYFDVRKDSLYCDARGAARRRAARSVLDILFDTLTAWLAPVLAFTAEEAWLARHPDTDGSVHLRSMPGIPPSWRDDALAAKWRRLRAIRRVVTGALEVARRERRIGASLQARPRVWLGASDAAGVDASELAELAIASDLEIACGEAPEDAFRLDDAPGVGVEVAPAPGEKCARCWRVLPKVAGRGLCLRCADVVSSAPAAA